MPPPTFLFEQWNHHNDSPETKVFSYGIIQLILCALCALCGEIFLSVLVSNQTSDQSEKLYD